MSQYYVLLCHVSYVSDVSRSRVTRSCGARRAAPSPRPAGEPAAPAGGPGASKQVAGRSSLDAVDADLEELQIAWMQ